MISVRVGWLIGIAVVLAVGGVAGCTSAPEEARPPVLAPGRPGEPASTIPPGQVTAPAEAPPNAEDVRYVQDMVVHHQQAIEMARLAPDRAAADDVRRVADRIASSQGPEIEALNGWLRGHGQPTVDPEHAGHGDHGGMPGMATPAQLDALRAATGGGFDRMFLELMITHHQGALTMSTEIQTKGADTRVQEIADEVIATQSAEINRMRAILGR